jgi:hypothetical protein
LRPRLKLEKIAVIKADGLARTQAVFPAISDYDLLRLVVDIMTSIVPAARQLTGNMTKAQQIWTAGQNAIASVNAATTAAEVGAVTPAWPV